jgi:hypothetical protein
MDDLRRELARVFRAECPGLAAAVDRAIQRGTPPAEIMGAVDLAAQVAPGTVIPGLIREYLCEIDPDFRRAEEAGGVR